VKRIKAAIASANRAGLGRTLRGGNTVRAESLHPADQSSWNQQPVRSARLRANRNRQRDLHWAGGGSAIYQTPNHRNDLTGTSIFGARPYSTWQCGYHDSRRRFFGIQRAVAFGPAPREQRQSIQPRAPRPGTRSGKWLRG